jgi:hypothetical protein
MGVTAAEVAEVKSDADFDMGRTPEGSENAGNTSEEGYESDDMPYQPPASITSFVAQNPHMHLWHQHLLQQQELTALVHERNEARSRYEDVVRDWDARIGASYARLLALVQESHPVTLA